MGKAWGTFFSENDEYGIGEAHQARAACHS